MYEFVLIFGAVLWASLLIYYLRQSCASAFHPASYYFVFHGLIFVIRPILAYRYDFAALYSLYQFQPSPAEQATVLAAADLAFLIFILITIRIGRERFHHAAGIETEAGEHRGLTKAFWLTCVICVPVALYALQSTLAQKTTNVTTMVIDAGSGASINTTGIGYLSDTQLFLGPIAVLCAWLGRFRWYALLPMVAFIFARSGTGGRWPFVMAAMAAGLFYIYDRRLRWFSPKLLVAALPVMALFSIIGADRGAFIRGVFAEQTVAAEQFDYFAERPLESMDYANKEFFEYLVHTIPGKTGGYNYFLDNLQILTEPIPRALWPGKPVGSPIKTYSLFDYGTPVGMTYSMPGAGWVYLGWFGVIIWSVLFAAFYGKVYQTYVRSDQNAFKTVLYLVFIPISIQVFRDGVIITILKTSLFSLLPILIWAYLRRFDPVSRRDRALALANRRMTRTAARPAPATVPARRRRPARP